MGLAPGLVTGWPVAGALLTGGSSSRMGFDKALIPVDGQPNAARLAAVLRLVCDGPLVEVGPGRSGLPAVLEQPRGSGPLAATAAGAEALGRLGWAGPVVVVACDLPFLSTEALSAVVSWPGGRSVVPRWQGRWQPLCARWSAGDLELAARLVAEGQRSMQALLRSCEFDAFDADGQAPGTAASGWCPSAWQDVDTPADLRRLGLEYPRPSGEGA